MGWGFKSLPRSHLPILPLTWLLAFAGPRTRRSPRDVETRGAGTTPTTRPQPRSTASMPASRLPRIVALGALVGEDLDFPFEHVEGQVEVRPLLEEHHPLAPRDLRQVRAQGFEEAVVQALEDLEIAQAVRRGAVRDLENPGLGPVGAPTILVLGPGCSTSPVL